MSKRNVIPVQSTRCQPSKKTILKYLHEHVHKFGNEITNPDVTIDAGEPLKL